MRWLHVIWGRLEAMFGHRWNQAEPNCILQLVLVWVTTGQLGPKALNLVSRRPGSVLMGRQATERLCPLLHLFPELYAGTSHSYSALADLSMHATMRKLSKSAQAPPKAVFKSGA